MHPILFRIGGFPIHSYGVMLVVAFLFGIVIVRRRCPRFGIDPNKVTDALVGALFAGVVGARVTFIALDWPYYTAHPHELWSLQFAGLTSFGGLLFGFGWVWYWSHRQGHGLLKIIDLIAPAFLIATAIGRVGCFLNGCCYGGVCDVSYPIKLFVDGHWHVAAQLYDTAFNLIGLVLLLLIERRWRLLRGQSGGLALIFTAAARFIYEFWRAGTAAQVNAGLRTSEYLVGGLTEAQAAAILVALIGLGFCLAGLRKKSKVYEFESEAANPASAAVSAEAGSASDEKEPGVPKS